MDLYPALTSNCSNYDCLNHVLFIILTDLLILLDITIMHVILVTAMFYKNYSHTHIQFIKNYVSHRGIKGHVSRFGRTRLIGNHSCARFYFKLSRNSNYNMKLSFYPLICDEVIRKSRRKFRIKYKIQINYTPVNHVLPVRTPTYSMEYNYSLCAKRTLYNNSGLFRAIVVKSSYYWR